MKKIFFFILLLSAFSLAITIDMLAFKTDDGITLSLAETGMATYKDYSDICFFLNYPNDLPDKTPALSTSSFFFQKGSNIVSVRMHAITSWQAETIMWNETTEEINETCWTDEKTLEEVCEHTPYNKTTQHSKEIIEYEKERESGQIDSSKHELYEYCIRIENKKDKLNRTIIPQDSFSLSIGGRNPDPDISGCANLSEANTVYTLSDNITSSGTNCLNITAENITLDCNGNNITGDQTDATVGIGLDGFDNFTLENCQIYGYDIGIYYENGHNHTIQNTTIHANMTDGKAAEFKNMNDAVVENSTFIGEDETFNSNTNVRNMTIRNNTIISNDDYAADFYDMDYSFIINNTIRAEGDDFAVYSIASANNIFENNSIYTKDYYAIYLSAANEITFTGNDIESDDDRCLYLDTVDNSNFSNNTITGYSTSSVYISSYSNDNNFTNNTIIDEYAFSTGPTIYIYGSGTIDGNLFYNNTIIGAGSGGGTWIENTQSGNFFNTTEIGNKYGWYYNITYSAEVEWAWDAYDITSTSAPGYADGGSDRPFNTSNTQMFVGAGYPEDWHPWTENAGGAAHNADINITNISIAPAVAYADTNLTCNITYTTNESTLADAEYSWLKNGENQTGLAGTASDVANDTNTLISTLYYAGNISKGENWSCSVYMSDGTNISGANLTQNITILNSPPTNDSIGDLINSSTDSSFLVSAQFDDADGASDINYSNISTANGTCEYYENSTSGNTINITYNCSGSPGETTSLNISVNDTSDANITSGNIVNTFPGVGALECSNLTEPNTVYTMTANASIDNFGCFNITGQNVTLDCDGYTIQGNNASGTAGVYITGINATVKNCIIQNFSIAVNVSEDTADYANITNNTLNITYATSCGPITHGDCMTIYIKDADYYSITNNSIYTQTQRCIMIYNAATNGNISFNTISATSGYAVTPFNGASYVFYYGNNISTNTGTVFPVSTNEHNQILNNTITTNGIALQLTDSVNNTIADNNISSSASHTIYFGTDNNDDNNFTNNTLATNGTAIFWSSAVDGKNNTFILNNITAPIWMNVKETGNFFNDTSRGNIYYFSNGTASWDVFNITATSPPDWADGGADRPFSNSTIGAWLGEGNDSHPWTENGAGAAHNAYINITNASIFSSAGPYAGGWIAHNVTATTNESGALTCYPSPFKNGENQTALANSTVVANNTPTMIFNLTSGLVKGDIWNFTTYCTDGTNTSGVNITQGLTVANSAPTNDTINNLVNSSTDHSFLVNASVDDADGSADIDYSNISVNATSCVYLSNESGGNTFHITYNCTASSPQTVQFNISFNDTSEANITTGTLTNTYPDANNATLSVSITPATAYTYTELTCNLDSFTDLDGDVENASARTYRWFRNDSEVSGETSSTLVASFFNKTDEIICEIYAVAQNWTTSNNRTNSSTLTISNSIPTNVSALSYTDATGSHQFNASASAEDADGAEDIDIVNISSSLGSCTYLSNTTTDNNFTVFYNCSSTSEGSTTLRIGFNDTSGGYNQTGEDSHTYPDSAPTLGAPSITPNPAYTDSTLTCNAGSWSDPDGDSENASARAWRWFRNDTLIAGETSSTLAASFFNKTDEIICEETAYAEDWPTISNDVTNSSALAISNSAPENDSIGNLVNSSTDSSFLVNASVDDADGAADINYSNISNVNGTCVFYDNDTIGNTFRIRYNCTGTGGETTNLTISFNDTANANITTGSIVNTYPIIDANTPPFIDYLNLTPTSPYTTQNLLCNLTAIDNQSASINISYEWYKNGTNQTGLAGSINVSNDTNTNIINVSSSLTYPGENWSCRVRAWDGTNYSAWNISANITIQNTTLENATIGTLTNSSTDHSFTVNASIDDEAGGTNVNFANISISFGVCTQLNNDTVENTFRVMFNCTAYSEGNASFNISFNNTGQAHANTSTLQNTYPDANNVSLAINISPANPTYLNNLSCNLTSFTDLDGDVANNSNASYRWFKNDTLIGGETGQILENTTFGVSDNITCEINISSQNWSSSNNITNSSSVNISDTIPVSTAIVYPAESSTLGMKISNCALIVEIQTNGSGSSFSSTCNIYSANSSVNPSYVLLNAQTESYVNYSYNFTIPADFQNTSFQANCSSTIDGTTAYTQTVNFTVIETSFCTGGEGDTETSKEYTVLGFFAFGLGFIVLGARWIYG